MKKMKVMQIVWGIMIIAIVGTLTFIGFFYNRKLNDYQKYEKTLKKACEQYIDKNFLYQEVDKKDYKVSMDTLVEEGLITETKVNDNECKGYVIVSKNGMVYEYKAYIDCDKYKTEGYR